MEWYHEAQIAAFVLAAVFSWKTPRAPTWAMLLAMSYAISVLYVSLAPKGEYWPPSQFVGLLLDGLVLVVIREYLKERWEWALVVILAFMVTADLVQLFGALTGYPPPMSKNNFGILLEVLNYLALALIGGVGLLDRKRAYDDSRHHMARPRVGLLHRALAYAHRAAENPKPLRKW